MINYIRVQFAIIDGILFSSSLSWIDTCKIFRTFICASLCEVCIDIWEREGEREGETRAVKALHGFPVVPYQESRHNWNSLLKRFCGNTYCWVLWVNGMSIEHCLVTQLTSNVHVLKFQVAKIERAFFLLLLLLMLGVIWIYHFEKEEVRQDYWFTWV